MAFPVRTSSRRLQKKVIVKERLKQEAEQAKADIIDTPQDFNPIEEAVDEHRRSMTGRPQPAGVGKRRVKRQPSAKRATPLAAKEAAELLKEQHLLCGKDFERTGQIIEYSNGPDTFNFPTPSPRMPSRSATHDDQQKPTLPPGVLRRMTARDAAFLQPYGDSPRIGMADGNSLSGPPTWARSHTADVIMTTKTTAAIPPARPSSPTRHEEHVMNPLPQPKTKKKSNWRAFSNLFRNKTATDPFYQVKPQDTAVRVTAVHDAPTPNLKAPEVERPERPPTPLSCLAPAPEVSPLSSGRTSRQEQHPDASHRTSLLPKGLGIRPRGTPIPTTSPQPKSPGLSRRSEDILEQRQTRQDSPLSSENEHDEKPRPVLRVPRLDLDLPTLDFPRYSVMFEKQLLNSSKPSLRERRQSKLQLQRSQSQRDEEYLRVDTNGANVRLSRRQTSPSFKRTLAIRTEEEHTSTHDPATAMRRPGPMPRSKTASQAAATTPDAKFLQPKRHDTHQSSSPESPGSAFYSENSLPPTPTTAATCTDTDSVRHILDNAEPAWGRDNISTRPPIKSAPPPTIRSKSYSTPTNAPRPGGEYTHVGERPYPQGIKNNHDFERHIVQVSVARQVSVSRARTRVMRAMEGTAKPAVVPLRPRLVQLSPSNRKSAVGVLENAAAEMDEMPRDAAAHSRAASLAFSQDLKTKSEAG